jgi:hypothetical protein
MGLLLTYLLTSFGGLVAIYFIGLAIEQAWPAASLPAFLMLFFSMLYVTWIISVRITSAKDQPTAAR